MRLTVTRVDSIHVRDDNEYHCSHNCDHLSDYNNYCLLFDEELYLSGLDCQRCPKCRELAKPPAEAIADSACGKGF